MTLKLEAAVIEPRYNDESGGTGFLELRHVPTRALICLHIDGSTVEFVVRDHLSELCKVVGVDGQERKDLLSRAVALCTQSLLANQTAKKLAARR